MKAVILGGGAATTLFPLANHYPILAAPIANKPLVLHLLQSLQHTGFREVAIVAADHLPYYRALEQSQRRRGGGIALRLIEQRVPTGTAGALRDLGTFMRHGPVLVLSPSMYIERLDIARVFAFHLERKAGLTVVTEPGFPGGRSLENIKIRPDGQIEEFILLHESRDRRRRFGPFDPQHERRQTRRATGIYVVSPEALDCLPDQGYMDIKEQLIPALAERAIPAYAYEPDHALHRIHGVRDYVELNRDILTGHVEPQEFIFEGRRQIDQGVWVADNVTIARTAVLHGPIIIGRNCSIGENVTVLGPTCIGAGSELHRNSLVRESVLGRNVRIERRAVVEHSVVADQCAVLPREAARHTVLVDGRTVRGSLTLLPRRTSDGFELSVRTADAWSPSRVRHHAYLVTKRAMDIALSATALLLLAPLLALIALLVRLDSQGPIFFVQRRCGKKGREFSMYKFRTMVANAPALHDALVAAKDVDGPMFKMDNDPRITRLGRFLRKTSLDELPQLLNVLKGEMSLVGPRPLVMKEMVFAPSWRDIRLTVQPGITGLWQINGRDSVSFHDWIRHDVHYVKHQSLGMDFKILLSTFRVLKNATNV